MTHTTRDRNTNGQKQVHIRTRTQMDTDMDRETDMDMDNVNGQLTKNIRALKAFIFGKILKNLILNDDTF
jgi:hypothetical protein